MQNNEIKLKVEQKIQHTRSTLKKIIDNENEYAEEPFPKEKSEKRHCQSQEQLISHLESDKYKLKPNTFKLLIHTNKRY